MYFLPIFVPNGLESGSCGGRKSLHQVSNALAKDVNSSSPTPPTQ